MQSDLENLIQSRAKRLIREHQTYLRELKEENFRRIRRSSSQPNLITRQDPQSWTVSDGFNPYHVRNRSRAIAHAVSMRIKSGTYAPHTPAAFAVRKPDGGERFVRTFEIADEAVSTAVFRSLIRKNLPRLSGRTYAYRPDLKPQDAISYVSSEFRRARRLFVAEYDFRRYFENIDHEFIFESLDSHGIVRTTQEDFLIRQFITSPPPQIVTSDRGTDSEGRGIALGTSISLFLANLAATELDSSLERIGVGFARFADDIIMWSTDYGRITDAVEALYEAAENIGVPVNPQKSRGIHLLLDESIERGEMQISRSVDFLGHSVHLNGVRMRDSAAKRIKTKIDHLIYVNLLLEPQNHTQATSRLTTVDRDYAALIWQLRRYIYGALSEQDVRRFARILMPRKPLRGVMAFFPMVDDEAQLRDLDAWLLNRVWLALRKRRHLLISDGIDPPDPHGLTRAELYRFQTLSERTGQKVDLRLPSFLRISKMLRFTVNGHGFDVLEGEAARYLYDDSET